MGLVNRAPKRIDVPGEPGAWIDIRMLSWLTLDKAKTLKLREIGGLAATFAELRDALASNGDGKTIEREAIAAAKKDPFASYDQLTLLKHGVVAWSYDVDPVDVELFDEKTAEYVARAVFDFTVPREEESKASSSPSTGT